MKIGNWQLKIVNNTLAQLVSKGVGVVLTLFTTILIMRYAGPNLFGDLTKSLALIAVGFTAIDFGLNAAAVRSMGKSESTRAALFADLLLARLLLSLVVTGLLNILIWLLPGGYTASVKSTFWVGSLSIVLLGVYTSANALFQRQLAYWRSTLALIAGTILGTAITYLVIITAPTLFNLLVAYTLGYFLTGGLALLFLGRLELTFSLPRALRLLKSALWLGLTLVASIVASRVDTVIMGVFRSSSEVGYYGLAYRAFEVALTLPTFAMNALFPLLLDAGLRARGQLIKNSLTVLLILGTFTAAMLYYLAPLLLIIRPDVEEAVQALRLLALSLPLFYLTSPLMWDLIAKKQEKLLCLVYLLAALFNGAANLLLTPHFGFVAAAILTGITELFIFLALLYYSRKAI